MQQVKDTLAGEARKKSNTYGAMAGAAAAEACTIVAPNLVLEPGWNLTSHTLRSWVDEPCVRTATCNEIERKLPAVPTELPRSLSTDGGPSITHFFGSSEASSYRAARRTFEHKLAHGLQKLDWVQDVVRLFAARLVAFVLRRTQSTATPAGEHAEDAYLLAFVGRSPVPAQRDAWTDCRGSRGMSARIPLAWRTSSADRKSTRLNSSHR